MCRLLLGACIAFALYAPVAAQSASPQVTTPQGVVELIAGPRLGSKVWLGLRFQLQEKWHIYWRNPGDSGGPPTITWRLPEGVSADAFEWPLPERIPLGPLMNYGYEGEVVLPVRLRLTGRALKAPLPIRADARWLVCREVCLSGKGSLELTIPAAGAPASQAVESGRLIARARALVPQKAPASWRASARSEREHYVLSVSLDKPAGTAVFFPLEESQVDDSTAPVVTVSGKTVHLRLRKSAQLVKDPPSLRGVLALASGGGFEITAPITTQRGTP